MLLNKHLFCAQDKDRHCTNSMIIVPGTAFNSIGEILRNLSSRKKLLCGHVDIVMIALSHLYHPIDSSWKHYLVIYKLRGQASLSYDTSLGLPHCLGYITV